jgi:hypothetical protein
VIPGVQPIRQELDRAAAEGVLVEVWWRDDDAVAPTLALDRLLALSARYEVPVAIAAIPAGVEESLPARLRLEPRVTVLAHGFAHANHAPFGSKAAEFGDARPLPTLIEEAKHALGLHRAAFGAAAFPVFVPPWNRVAPSLIEALPDLGYLGLSAFGPRAAVRRPPGLAVVNTHLDPIDWRGSRGLVDPALLAASLARQRRKSMTGGSGEPIGLLTHHLASDDMVWTFCEMLLDMLTAHPAVRFPAPADLWAEPARSEWIAAAPAPAGG